MTQMNTTTSPGLLPGMQTFYDRTLLRVMKPLLIHDQFSVKKKLPKNSGKTISFRRWTPFKSHAEPLTEGVTPEGDKLTQTDVKATIKQLGNYVVITDVISTTHIDSVVTDATEMMGDQGSLTVDHVVRDEMHKSTNVLYASKKTSRAALTADDRLSSRIIRDGVRILKKAKAPKINGYYVGIVGPDAIFDLQDDPVFQDVSKYQDKEKIYTGEIGRIYGCRIVETTEAKVYEGEGAGGINVLSMLLLGGRAYGSIDIDGDNVKTIIKPPGSSGTEDPLDQRSTVGWKVNGMATVILEDAWLMRVEAGTAA